LAGLKKQPFALQAVMPSLRSSFLWQTAIDALAEGFQVKQWFCAHATFLNPGEI
jgi:hypothetical protein